MSGRGNTCLNLMYRVALLLLGVIAASQMGWTKEKIIQVVAVNPLKLERKSETLAIQLAAIKKHFPSVKVDQLVVADTKTGVKLLSQVTSDEFLFESDFKPNERKSFVIRELASAPVKAQSLVDGQFVPPREDYAWENDRIAFRMYGPAMAKEVDNGIDVWTKRVRHLIVEKWYRGDEDTGSAKIPYHVDHGEGADFFSVGRTLGGGSSGIWHNKKVHQSGVFTSQKTIVNGPLRVTFELTYDRWNIEGKRLTEVKRISLDAGQNLNKIEVMFAGLPSDSLLQIACGLVKRKNTTSSGNEKHGWLSLWGPTNDDSANGSLGTGVVVPKPAFVGMNEDSSQFIIIGKTVPERTFTYYAGAGWTKSGDFATEAEWKDYLDAFARRVASPLHVTLTRK